jgi:hypothetical protein
VTVAYDRSNFALDIDPYTQGQLNDGEFYRKYGLITSAEEEQLILPEKHNIERQTCRADRM